MTSSLSLCAQEIRKNEHDQFLCGLFAPEDRQNDFFAMQLFHMETLRIRDAVSEPHLGLIRLQWWRDLVDGIYNGDKSPDAENGTHQEIAQTLARRSIDKTLFDRYFNARSFDMEDCAHDDMSALVRYCEATGGLSAQIKEAAIGCLLSEASLKVGTANALCHVIRTLAHQSRVARCKLPLLLIKKHNLDLNGFYKFESSFELKNIVAELVSEIERLIADARREGAMPNAVLLNTVSLEDYLKRLKKVDCDPFNPNIGQGRLSKQIKLALKAWRNRY